ncbi:MAG: flavin reductase family protein [Eubacteriaceae bacterium]|jgi:flavin reductase (DIM6/NTAB) family NADH-FMN oxidoreductase RutF|nr:flavin reductase family protein [Eubacteriaceae bacterium]
MKKNLGAQLALYPTPLTVIGAMNGEKPTWTLVAHVGIIGHDRLLVSLSSAHFINGVIKKTNRLSINMVSEAILPQADYVGSVSGNQIDKSDVFDYETGERGTPMIKDSPLSIECEVEDIYKTEGFESFIVKFSGTYVDENDITDEGKINYRTMKPVLFEFPTYEYLRTGDVIGKCLSLKKGK